MKLHKLYRNKFHQFESLLSIVSLRVLGGFLNIILTLCFAAFLEPKHFVFAVSFMQVTTFFSAIFGMGLQSQLIQQAKLSDSLSSIRTLRVSLIVNIFIILVAAVSISLLFSSTYSYFPTNWQILLESPVVFASAFLTIIILSASVNRGLGYHRTAEIIQFVQWRVIALCIFALIWMFYDLSTGIVINSVFCLISGSMLLASLAGLVLTSRSIGAVAENFGLENKIKKGDTVPKFESNMPVTMRVSGSLAHLLTQVIGLVETFFAITFLTSTEAAIYLFATRMVQWMMFVNRSLDASLVRKLVVLDAETSIPLASTRNHYVFLTISALIVTLALILIVTTVFLDRVYIQSIIPFLILSVGFLLFSSSGASEQFLLVNQRYGRVILSRMAWLTTFLVSAVLAHFTFALDSITLSIAESLAFAVLGILLRNTTP